MAYSMQPLNLTRQIRIFGCNMTYGGTNEPKYAIYKHKTKLYYHFTADFLLNIPHIIKTFLLVHLCNDARNQSWQSFSCAVIFD